MEWGWLGCFWLFFFFCPEQVEPGRLSRSASSPLRAALLPAAHGARLKEVTSPLAQHPHPAASPDLSCTQKCSFSRPSLSAEQTQHLSPTISVELVVAEGLLPKNSDFCTRGAEKRSGLGASLVPGASPGRISASPIVPPFPALGETRRASPPPSLSRHPKMRLPAPLPTLTGQGWGALAAQGVHKMGVLLA